MPEANAVRLSCLDDTRRWRRQAGHLRDLSMRPHLCATSSALLQREAAAAERQADIWLMAAIEL